LSQKCHVPLAWLSLSWLEFIEKYQLSITVLSTVVQCCTVVVLVREKDPSGFHGLGFRLLLDPMSVLVVEGENLRNAQ